MLSTKRCHCDRPKGAKQSHAFSGDCFVAPVPFAKLGTSPRNDSRRVASTKQKNFGTFGFKSQRPTTEFMLNLTYNFTGVTPGKYKIETTVRDNHSDKKASETVEIEVK